MPPYASGCNSLLCISGRSRSWLPQGAWSWKRAQRRAPRAETTGSAAPRGADGLDVEGTEFLVQGHRGKPPASRGDASRDPLAPVSAAATPASRRRPRRERVSLHAAGRAEAAYGLPLPERSGTLPGRALRGRGMHRSRSTRSPGIRWPRARSQRDFAPDRPPAVATQPSPCLPRLEFSFRLLSSS